MHYVNKKGIKVPVTITKHAKDRFFYRWNKLFPQKAITEPEIEPLLTKWFSKANRVKNLSAIEKSRMEKHGNDSMYFRTNMFTFIVQNSTLITVEVSDESMRHVNKSPFLGRFLGVHR